MKLYTSEVESHTTQQQKGTERHIFVTLQKLDAQAPYAIGLSDTDQVSDT